MKRRLAIAEIGLLMIALCVFSLGDVIAHICTTQAGGGGIAFDVAGTPQAVFNVSSVTVSHTVTSGKTNSVVVAVLGWAQSGSPGTISGCSYNGTSMTQIWNIRETLLNVYGTGGFIIANGTGSGTAHDVVCNFGWTSTGAVGLMTLSYSGVNQSTMFRTTSGNQFDTTSGSQSLTVSNAQSGDMVIDGFMFGSSTPATSGQTPRSNITNMLGSGYTVNTSSAAASGSTDMSYTFDTNEKIGRFQAAPLIPQ